MFLAESILTPLRIHQGTLSGHRNPTKQTPTTYLGYFQTVSFKMTSTGNRTGSISLDINKHARDRPPLKPGYLLVDLIFHACRATRRQDILAESSSLSWQTLLLSGYLRSVVVGKPVRTYMPENSLI